MKFKKGNVPWNKGKKGVQVAWNKGKPNPELRERNLIDNPSKRPGVAKKISEANKDNIRVGCRKYMTKKYRLAMENNLGRKLKSCEIVHHLDGNFRNNNLNNLMVVSRSEHAKIHWKQGDIRRAKF